MPSGCASASRSSPRPGRYSKARSTRRAAASPDRPPPDPLGRRAVALGTPRSASGVGGEWRFELPASGPEPLLKALIEGGAGIETLSIERPGLHDAFIAIAGEAARARWVICRLRRPRSRAARDDPRRFRHRPARLHRDRVERPSCSSCWDRCFPSCLGWRWSGSGRRSTATPRRRRSRSSPASEDFDLLSARARLSPAGDGAAGRAAARRPQADLAAQRARLLRHEADPVIAVLDGGLCRSASHRRSDQPRPDRPPDRLFVDEARRSWFAVNRRAAAPADPDHQHVRAAGVRPQHDRARRPDPAVRADDPAGRHAPEPADRGEIEQGDRGACRGGPGRCHFPRQAVRHARHVAGRDRRVGDGRGAGGRPVARRAAWPRWRRRRSAGRPS